MSSSVVTVDPVPLAADLTPTLEHTVAQAGAARKLAARVVERGLRTVYFIGCGGSYYSTFPAQDLMERYAHAPAAHRMTAGEMIHRDLAGLDESALVIASSHSGATPETLEAVRLAKKAGATVAGIARSVPGQSSPLADEADALFDYPSDVTVTEPKAIHFTQLALAVLEASGSLPNAEEAWQAVAAIPRALTAAKQEVTPLGREVAAQWRDARLVYVLGAGPNFGAANALAACYLQEMNWLHASAVNAGDFFHGPFEIVGQHPVLILNGEDETRAMGERAVTFAERYYDTWAVLDSKDFTLPGVPEAQRGLISPLAVASASRRLLDFCAAERGHNTAQRRYMYRVAY
ncbi:MULTISPECIES: SIS domain-containing protein [Streptomyces]|uniref:SIS domain-containing protein n=1 Tax=Streptomyces TaxID=1883 RepID=UPI00055D3A81|nr:MULTISPECIES: SIS domain-containing protein [Streptomyces]MDI6410098.1 SIS domain-containing protein [Streptomyces albus]QID39759.1 SIS domain-containing protein [Streptomyces albus]